MKIKICGIPHTVVEMDDKFNADSTHFGQIEYGKAEILINKNMPAEMKEETLYHEVLHGMLHHLGFYEQSNDEHFVQALSNAIYQSFDVKKEDLIAHETGEERL